MDPALRRIELALTRARRRLRARRAISAAAVALHAGLVLTLPLAAGLRLTGLLPSLAVAALAVALVAVAVGVGAALGALWPGLDRRALALLVDRVGGTDELVLTALHVAGTDDPNRGAILGRAAALDVPELSRGLPVEVPRHTRWALATGALLALACFAPPLPGWTRPDRGATALAEEGRRLEERLEELGAAPEGVELPEDLEREVADLADELKGEALSPEEALERLEDLGEQLKAFEASLAPSTDLLDELEQAARDLDAQATDELREALEAGDLDAAADAARDLAEDLAEATPEERARAADAMRQAGERLSGSGDPTMQGVGEALERAGEQIADPTRAAGEGQPGEPGGDPGRSGEGGEPSGLTPEQAQELARELTRARELGEQLQRDRQALQRAQQIRGAAEGSRQRLGGDTEVARGESSQGGSSSSASGEGASQQGDGGGTGVGAQQPSPTAGRSHTWEDEGSMPLGTGDRAETSSDRTEGSHVDDFEKLYEAARLDDAEALLAGASGRLDDRGRVEELSLRLTEGRETARTGTIQLPEAYREAAAEAIEAEPIPPSYREAVRDYFDDP